MRLARGLASACVIAIASWGGRVARAQDAPEGEPSSGETAKEGIEGGDFDNYDKAGVKEKKIKPEYGVGLRVRGVFEPKGVIELFVKEAASGMFHPGFGLELNRRRGNFELVLGLEYENVSPKDGYYLEKGDDGISPGETPDFINFDGLAWFTADLAFVFHSPINDKVSFRYGAGFGLGLVLGDVLQTDSVCTGRDIQNECVKDTSPGAQIDDPADIPPVFPVVDLLAGFQFKPTPKMTVNLEAGLRTLFFFGLSSTYYF
jgi:hypothetical protein